MSVRIIQGDALEMLRGIPEGSISCFPTALIRPCILAGCQQGGTVLDPFAGSGTTGEVAEEEGRNSILIELNPKYVRMIARRTAQQGLFAQPPALDTPGNTDAQEREIPE